MLPQAEQKALKATVLEWHAAHSDRKLHHWANLLPPQCSHPRLLQAEQLGLCQLSVDLDSASVSNRVPYRFWVIYAAVI